MDELIPYRNINDISLSPVSLGTMRWADKGLSQAQLTELIVFLYREAGINTHHSSYEYSSYELYCKALADVQKDKAIRLNHICKLSAPDFKEGAFSKAAIRNKILAELKNLRTERIDILQWLYRTEPLDDKVRIPALANTSAEIEAAFNEFIQEGIVGAIGTFPYSIDFGRSVAESIPANTGWVTYFNLHEREYLDNLPEHQWMIGIRPFFAGKLATSSETADILPPATENTLNDTEKLLKKALKYCFGYTQVKSNILSINSMTQAKSLVTILQQLHCEMPANLMPS